MSIPLWYLTCVPGSYMRIVISETSSLMFSKAGSGLDVLLEYHICLDYIFTDAPNPSIVTSVLAEITGRHHHNASIAWAKFLHHHTIPYPISTHVWDLIRLLSRQGA